MALTMDPDGLQAFLKMNRDSLDMKVPMAVEFKLHFMEQRRQILTNYRHQATGMAMLLNILEGDEPNLIRCKEQVKEFREWLFQELAALDALGDTTT